MEKSEYIALEAKKELARRYFYDYCLLKYEQFYDQPDRNYLKDLCETLQRFVEQNEKRFLVVNLPPRHIKSNTGKNFTEWLFGRDPSLKVMTAGYNETLSTTFARKVRNAIEEEKLGSKLVYNDIFPKTKVRFGEASASAWALEGNEDKSYLSTSPTGIATGFGANIIIVDDIIKNAEEAYSDIVLDRHWEWFNNTMMQRTEGNNWKFIIIMTRWATNDLAGRILTAFDNVEHITYKAVQDDGSMLCPSILSKEDYLIKTKDMNLDIAEANYNQKPVDVKGRLYSEFKEYETLPSIIKKKNYTDTADKGTDFLCSVDYVEHGNDVYITDVVMTDEAMEYTEPKVAAMLDSDNVHEAVIESNNGGRGFARNIKRLLETNHGNIRCSVIDKPQTGNKEARIISSSAWVQEHIFMPINWKHKYPEFYNQLMSYQKKGRNKHDDAPDVLAGIYEDVTSRKKVEFSFS